MERNQRKIQRKGEHTWPAHVLPGSSHFSSHVSRCQFSDRDMLLQKSSEVTILVSLRWRRLFLHTTVYRITNSGRLQVKITPAFSERDIPGGFGVSAVLTTFGTQTLLPPQGFGPEAKTRGGTLGGPGCIHTRTKNIGKSKK